MGIEAEHEDKYTQSDLRKLRLDGLPLLLAGQYVLMVAFAALPFGDTLPDRYWVAIVSPIVAFGIYALHQRFSSAAAALTVLTLMAFWAAALWYFSNETVVLLGVLVVGVASTMFGPRGAVMTAVILSGVLAFVGSRVGISVVLWVGGVVNIWFGVFLFWLSARPSDMTLEWAWASYADARQTQDELRRHQGELNRVLKTLDLAYRRLEHLNDELNQARHAAERAHRLKSEFAVSISHELRTPLNLILGFSEMMVATPHAYGSVRLPPPYQADVDAIFRNAQHLAGLIDDVLDLSQLEAGRPGLSREWSNLAQVADEAVSAVEARLSNSGLSLTVDFPDDLPPVLIDRTRIRQILINLLNNAARFTDAGGAQVHALRGDHEVVVSVTDTGIGISADDVAHVFDEFYQSNGNLQRRAGGSGVGLTISKRLVELHGGAMWVESVVGQGSTFSFSLPLVDNVVTGGLAGDWEMWDRVVKERPTEDPVLGLLTDDPSIARTFRRYLDGYRIVPIQNIDEVRKVTEDSTVQGVVFATESASECWQRLCRVGDSGTHLPIAAVTFSSARSRATDLGVRDYLSKPITRTQIEQTLKRLGKSVRTILVVDDNADMVHLLGQMIRRYDRRLRVLQATAGREALVIMAECQPDLILLDLLMPDIDGYGVLTAMRADERLRDIPVVAVSGGTATAEASTIGIIGIARPDGFSTDETLRCLRGCFDALRAEPGGHNA